MTDLRTIADRRNPVRVTIAGHTKPVTIDPSDIEGSAERALEAIRNMWPHDVNSLRDPEAAARRAVERIVEEWERDARHENEAAKDDADPLRHGDECLYCGESVDEEDARPHKALKGSKIVKGVVHQRCYTLRRTT